MNGYSLLIGIICFGIGFALAILLKEKIISKKIKATEAEANRNFRRCKSEI